MKNNAIAKVSFRCESMRALARSFAHSPGVETLQLKWRNQEIKRVQGTKRLTTCLLGGVAGCDSREGSITEISNQAFATNIIATFGKPRVCAQRSQASDYWT